MGLSMAVLNPVISDATLYVPMGRLDTTYSPEPFVTVFLGKLVWRLVTVT
jgi:hypothetical protein